MPKYFPQTRKYFEHTILYLLSCQLVYISINYIAAEKIFEVVQILAQILTKEIKPVKIYKCKLHVNCIPVHIYENNANANTLIFKTFSLLISLSIDIQTN